MNVACYNLQKRWPMFMMLSDDSRRKPHSDDRERSRSDDGEGRRTVPFGINEECLIVLNAQLWPVQFS